MKYRAIVPIALVVLMAVSIYSMVSDAMSQKKTVQDLLQKASSCAQQELYDKAASYYTEILDIDDNVKYYVAAIDMYFDAGQFEPSYEWCEKAISSFPKDPSVYEKMIRVCLKTESYAEAFETLNEFDGRKLNSDTVEEYRKQMEFLYWEEGVSFDDVSTFSSDYIASQNKEKWGLASSKGSSKVKAKFNKVGYFANDLVAVMDENNKWFLINADGEYMYNVTDSVGGTVTDVGLYNNELVPVCKDGKYNYYDINFKAVLEGYDFAGSFSGGVAAVKKGNVWEVVNDKGENITGEQYADVILDERGVCCQKDRIFVKISDYEYKMINSSGEQIGSETFEDAHLFASDGYAAIEKGGLWGFIDKDGKIIIEPSYEAADSFSMGLAAVSDGTSWGYIDMQGNEIIELQYTDCKRFSSAGTTFVKDDKYWKIIKLYKYNY